MPEKLRSVSNVSSTALPTTPPPPKTDTSNLFAPSSLPRHNFPLELQSDTPSGNLGINYIGSSRSASRGSSDATDATLNLAIAKTKLLFAGSPKLANEVNEFLVKEKSSRDQSVASGENNESAKLSPADRNIANIFAMVDTALSTPLDKATNPAPVDLKYPKSVDLELEEIEEAPFAQVPPMHTTDIGPKPRQLSVEGLNELQMYNELEDERHGLFLNTEPATTTSVMETHGSGTDMDALQEEEDEDDVDDRVGDAVDSEDENDEDDQNSEPEENGSEIDGSGFDEAEYEPSEREVDDESGKIVDAYTGMPAPAPDISMAFPTNTTFDHLLDITGDASQVAIIERLKHQNESFARDILRLSLAGPNQGHHGDDDDQEIDGIPVEEYLYGTGLDQFVKKDEVAKQKQLMNIYHEGLHRYILDEEEDDHSIDSRAASAMAGRSTDDTPRFEGKGKGKAV